MFYEPWMSAAERRELARCLAGRPCPEDNEEEEKEEEE